jgi:hypothetical protein
MRISLNADFNPVEFQKTPEIVSFCNFLTTHNLVNNGFTLALGLYPLPIRSKPLVENTCIKTVYQTLFTGDGIWVPQIWGFFHRYEWATKGQLISKANVLLLI